MGGPWMVWDVDFELHMPKQATHGVLCILHHNPVITASHVSLVFGQAFWPAMLPGLKRHGLAGVLEFY